MSSLDIIEAQLKEKMEIVIKSREKWALAMFCVKETEMEEIPVLKVIYRKNLRRKR
jgi:hypothetical protein